jgi:hypothetical protein
MTAADLPCCPDGLPMPPRPVRRRTRRALRELRGCSSGLALIEFAFALPVLLALSLYGFETANLALAHMRVSNIAMLTADNAARIRDSIDEANVIELMLGAKMSGEGIAFAGNARVILSSFELAPAPNNTQQWMRWQRCDGALNVTSAYGAPKTAGGANITNGTEIYNADRMTTSSAPSSSAHATSRTGPIGAAGGQVFADPGAAVMLVEVVYNYQPIVSSSLFGPVEIRYVSAFKVRQRTNTTLINAGRATPKSCNTFQS